MIGRGFDFAGFLIGEFKEAVWQNFLEAFLRLLAHDFCLFRGKSRMSAPIVFFAFDSLISYVEQETLYACRFYIAILNCLT